METHKNRTRQFSSTASTDTRMARRGRARRIATCPHPNPPIVSGGGVRIGVPRIWAHLSCLPSFHCQVGQAPPGARPIWPRSLPSGCGSPLSGALRTGPRWAECPVIPFVSSVSRTAPPGSRRTSARLPRGITLTRSRVLLGKTRLEGVQMLDRNLSSKAHHRSIPQQSLPPSQRKPFVTGEPCPPATDQR